MKEQFQDMKEQFQEASRDLLAYQGALTRYSKSEQGFIREYPGKLVEASIACADGFLAPVAIDKSNLKNYDLPIPGQVAFLHDKFHKVAGYKNCEGLHFNFNS